MDQKWHPTLVAVARESRDIGDVRVFGCRQGGLCLFQGLPGCFEVWILVECDPQRLTTGWNFERRRTCTGVEINRSIHRDPESVRELTPQVLSLQPQG